MNSARPSYSVHRGAPHRLPAQLDQRLHARRQRGAVGDAKLVHRLRAAGALIMGKLGLRQRRACRARTVELEITRFLPTERASTRPGMA